MCGILRPSKCYTQQRGSDRVAKVPSAQSSMAVQFEIIIRRSLATVAMVEVVLGRNSDDASIHGQGNIVQQ